nr:preprotein translocase subunit SecA [Anaerophilus nitritogenes]
MASFLAKLFDSNEREIQRIEKKVQNILALEENIKKLSDEELRNKTLEFKDRLKSGQTLDDLLEEAFAVVREASFRVLHMRHFPVQLMGGIVLHEGNIAEMKTGEGKTLVSTLPAYLNALTEDGVFVITVNDYLALRDREEMGQVHEFLGLSVGLIQNQMSIEQKKEAYRCDITYGTNSEFGFDYLRDNMVVLRENRVQRKLNYVILDEVDNILIDEARTPLIISGQGNRPSQYYMTVDKFVKSLKKDEDYEYDPDAKLATLLDSGMDKVEKIFGIKNIAAIGNIELLHHIRQSLHANYVMKKDQDYVVKDGEIQIVDRFTGRLMPGRRYSNGLHQAIEAKENVEIQKESKTMATITYQNFFKMFHKISGMTGTASTEKLEIREIYGMDVVAIPTNKQTIRQDKEDIVFKTKKAKLKAIANEVKKRHKKGQPVLIGTIFIDQSEEIASLLKKNKVPFQLLNAKQDKNEAQIIMQAGQKRAVTIATNMAGRGTDIKLGKGVEELGGLFVLGTERHESRRIDNQLRGRAGRQGDPGESQFFISLEDTLFERLGQENMENMQKTAQKIGLEDDEPLQDKILSKAIERTQKNIESVNYRIRKSTLEFDQILNKQRETIYKERNKILNGEDMSGFIKNMIQDVIKRIVIPYTEENPFPEEWDLVGLQKELNTRLSFKNRIDFSPCTKVEIEQLTKEELINRITEEGLKIYEEREEVIEANQLRYMEQLILMKNIDKSWMDHLDVVEQIRQGIGFQGVGREDPIRVFNQEAFDLFDDMLESIKENTVKVLFGLEKRENIEQNNHKKPLTKEEIKEKIEILEEKYKLNKRYLSKIPANLPKITLNMDINAIDHVEVEIGLYYLEDGVEERITNYDYKKVVKGVFSVEFEKPKDKDWNKGWYQVKAFVSGEEASNINFMITDPMDLKELESRNNAQKSLDSNIAFFSNKSPMITFQLKIKDAEKEMIKGAIAYHKNYEKMTIFNIPIKDHNARIRLERPQNGWQNGFYEFLTIEDQKKVVCSFMIVDEFSSDTEKINIPLKIEEQYKSIDLEAQLANIENRKIVFNMPIKIEETGIVNMEIKRQKENLEIGRYEFRLMNKNELILTKHFLIK